VLDRDLQADEADVTIGQQGNLSVKRLRAEPRDPTSTSSPRSCQFCGPTCADEARALLRDLRQLLAGDPE
jgi:hypothetical protein